MFKTAGGVEPPQLQPVYLQVSSHVPPGQTLCRVGHLSIIHREIIWYERSSRFTRNVHGSCAALSARSCAADSSLSCICLMLNIQYERSSVRGCQKTPSFYLGISISVGSSIFSIHLQVISPAHLNISHLLSPSCSPYSLNLSCPLFSLLPALPYISFHFPSQRHLLHADAHMRFLSLHPSLPLSLSVPSPLSVSLCCALMNYLPLPVNSTDNPGEAVKDHRSAPQTGPQATAEEQHANNKPLHLAP